MLMLKTLTKLAKFLKRGNASGPDTIHNEILRPGHTTLLFHYLAGLFTSSIQLGYITTAWEIATLSGDQKKYSCLIKRKMHNKRGIFKIEIVFNYQ